MKIFTLFLALINLAITTLQAQSNEYSEKHLEAIHKLKTAETFQEKYLALIHAEKFHSREVDELIVSYLDDKTKAEALSPNSDILTQDIDITAMYRFDAKYPEANINYRITTIKMIKEVRKLTNISDTERRIKFKEARQKAFELTQSKIRTWWAENKDYIEYYGDNQYRIIPLEEREPKKQETPSEPKDSKINPNLLTKTNTQQSTTQKTTQQPKPQQTTSKSKATEDNFTNWVIYVLAVVILLIILIFLKLKKTK